MGVQEVYHCRPNGLTGDRRCTQWAKRVYVGKARCNRHEKALLLWVRRTFRQVIAQYSCEEMTLWWQDHIRHSWWRAYTASASWSTLSLNARFGGRDAADLTTDIISFDKTDQFDVNLWHRGKASVTKARSTRLTCRWIELYDRCHTTVEILWLPLP